MPVPAIAVPVRAAAALTALVLLAGCAGTEPPVATPPADAAGPAAPEGSGPAPSEEADRRVEVRYADGQVGGDTGRVPVELGDRVVLVVRSDVADEVHVHGYDRTAVVGPAGPATLEWTADIPGVFEVELHEAGAVLVTLQVG
ncbi:MAG TPA: hypothetical protein VHF92_11240 [Geodermatophilus sp.]|nr:hypothetical protein [Geodermatophilus sp.]